MDIHNPIFKGTYETNMPKDHISGLILSNDAIKIGTLCYEMSL